MKAIDDFVVSIYESAQNFIKIFIYFRFEKALLRNSNNGMINKEKKI